jgi:hypothetical protein
VWIGLDSVNKLIMSRMPWGIVPLQKFPIKPTVACIFFTQLQGIEMLYKNKKEEQDTHTQ